MFTVNKEQPFKDKCFLYKFRLDEEGFKPSSPTDDISLSSSINTSDQIRDALTMLLQRGPDATLRMILRKP